MRRIEKTACRISWPLAGEIIVTYAMLSRRRCVILGNDPKITPLNAGEEIIASILGSKKMSRLRFFTLEVCEGGFKLHEATVHADRWGISSVRWTTDADARLMSELCQIFGEHLGASPPPALTPRVM